VADIVDIFVLLDLCLLQLSQILGIKMVLDRLIVALAQI